MPESPTSEGKRDTSRKSNAAGQRIPQNDRSGGIDCAPNMTAFIEQRLEVKAKKKKRTRKDALAAEVSTPDRSVDVALKHSTLQWVRGLR